jgi:putative phosphotransacetylase
MTPQDAERLHVSDNQIVELKINGLRGGIYNNVVVRVSEDFKLECHIDIEEAMQRD